MTVLDRYIVRAILGMVFLVLLVLLVLGGLFIFIDQQDDIGSGHYTALGAFWYTLLNLPQLGYELLPITALIGSLLGLGSLARGSELTVIRATGVSIARLAGTALLAGLILCSSRWSSASSWRRHCSRRRASTRPSASSAT
jgi:lipopolysaccharide export system permease protein